MAAAVVVGILLAVTTASFFNGDNKKEMVRRSADRASVWIKRRMDRASREGSDFVLYVFDRKGHLDHNSEIMVIWYGGESDTERESYTDDDCVVIYTSSVREHRYDGKWHTVTPAATFMIKSKDDPNIRLYMTLSGTGYIDIREKL